MPIGRSFSLFKIFFPVQRCGIPDNLEKSHPCILIPYLNKASWCCDESTYHAQWNWDHRYYGTEPTKPNCPIWIHIVTITDWYVLHYTEQEHKLKR
jgi:hypothetical protein